MVKKKLDPSVQKFKEFVQSNPKIILKVRKGEATWQELYEDWYLLGEDDPRWDSYRSEQTEQKESETEKKDDWKAQLIGLFKKMDANQIEKHIHNLSQALGAIQNVIGQFQESTKTKSTSEKVQPPHPFQFRKD
ncbi:YlbD family protein [Bacillus methanolicus]|uniref:YlbD family protein n=1 Tax=Bacillus methanolicus TaxID=1471 RepID=UPI0005571A6E|nr:YlbD family protein [Bacillus methanolicus]